VAWAGARPLGAPAHPPTTRDRRAADFELRRIPGLLDRRDRETRTLSMLDDALCRELAIERRKQLSAGRAFPACVSAVGVVWFMTRVSDCSSERPPGGLNIPGCARERPPALPGAFPNNGAAFPRRPNGTYSACDDSRLSRAAGYRCARPVFPAPLGEDRVALRGASHRELARRFGWNVQVARFVRRGLAGLPADSHPMGNASTPIG